MVAVHRQCTVKAEADLLPGPAGDRRGRARRRRCACFRRGGSSRPMTGLQLVPQRDTFQVTRQGRRHACCMDTPRRWRRGWPWTFKSLTFPRPARHQQTVASPVSYY